MYEKAVPNSLTFPQKLKAGITAGFDRLEISIDESEARLSRLDWPSSKRIELRNFTLSENCPITTMCLSAHRKYPLGSHNKETREKSIEIMKKAIDLANDIGIKIIQLAGYDVYYEQHDEKTEEFFLENLTKCVEMVNGSEIKLGFETMETEFMDTVGKAMKYVNLVNSKNLGVYPDIGNLQNAAVLYGIDVLEDLQKGVGHIYAIHLKETLPGIYRNLRFGDYRHTRYEECIQFAHKNDIRLFTGEFWYQDGQDYQKETVHSALFLREKLDSVYR